MGRCAGRHTSRPRMLSHRSSARLNCFIGCRSEAPRRVRTDVRYNGPLNTMRRLRTRKSFVLFGLAIVVFVAFVPALSSSLPSAILTPLWLVVPAVSVVVIRRTAARCDDQPVALLSLADFRAPPATLAPA